MRLSSLLRRHSVSLATILSSTRQVHTTVTTRLDMIPPALIDVDCNLLHADLQSLLYKDTNHDNVTTATKTKTKTTTTSFSILNEDAVAECNIVGMVSPSSTLEESKLSLALLQAHATSALRPELKTTVGVHPYHVDGLPTPHHLATVQAMIQQDHARVIRAIGECGLDVTEGFPPLDQQIPWFQAQVRWAQQLQMPLFVHERNAFHETTKLLQHTSVPVLIHCFTGTPSECQHYVERGYSISVSGHVCKPAGQSVRDCLSQRLIPWDKLMIETDAPYMGFESCRTHYLAKHNNNVTAKQRKRLSKGTYPNVPSSLPLVLQQVVECLNENPHYPPVTVEHVAKLTTQNARRFFGFA